MASSQSVDTGMPALDRATAVLGPDASWTRILVAAHMVASGTATIRQAYDALPIGRSTAKEALTDLADRGLAEFEVDDDDLRGRKTYVYEPAGVLARAQVAEDVPEEKRKDIVVEVFAQFHYRMGLSSATATRAARDAPGLSPNQVVRTLEKLEDEGAAERVLNTQTIRWRLVGAGEFAPYRAGGRDE